MLRYTYIACLAVFNLSHRSQVSVLVIRIPLSPDLARTLGAVLTRLNADFASLIKVEVCVAKGAYWSADCPLFRLHCGVLNFHCYCKNKCISFSLTHTHTQSGTTKSRKSVSVNKTSQNSSCYGEWCFNCSRVVYKPDMIATSLQPVKCASHYVAYYVTKNAFFKRCSPQQTAKCPPGISYGS